MCTIMDVTNIIISYDRPMGLEMINFEEIQIGMSHAHASTAMLSLQP